MDKCYFASSCTFSRLFVDETDSLFLKFFQCFVEIIHSYGKMMDPLSFFFNKLAYRAVFIGSFKELYLCILNGKKGSLNLLLCHFFYSFTFDSHGLLPEFQGFLDAFDSNSNMINYGWFHSYPPRCYYIRYFAFLN